MKAEEYLKKNSLKDPKEIEDFITGCLDFNENFEVVSLNTALESVSLARKEVVKDISYKVGQNIEHERLVCKDKLKEAEARVEKETAKEELVFLESLDIPDLYKQATVERTHFYVGSKCKALIERMNKLKRFLSKPQSGKGDGK